MLRAYAGPEQASLQRAHWRVWTFRGYLRWDDASADDEDVRPVELPEFLDELRDQGLVSCSKRADPDTVDVCVDGLLGNLEGSLRTKGDGKMSRNQRKCNAITLPKVAKASKSHRIQEQDL